MHLTHHNCFWLSGVGPADELAKHNIKQHLELPGVGKNLQEHPDVCVGFTSKKRDGISISIVGLFQLACQFFNYLFRKKGQLRASISEAGGYIKSSPSVEVPDIQLHFLPVLFDDNGRNLRALSKEGFSIHVCVVRPESRGEVTLQSADPLAPPQIELNLLSDENKHDVDILLAPNQYHHLVNRQQSLYSDLGFQDEPLARKALSG